MENMVESFRRKRPKLQARTRRLAGRRTLTGTRRGEETGTRASGRWPGSLPKAARRAKRDLGKVEIDCQRQLHRRSRLGNLRINRAGASEATHKDISRGGSRSIAGVRVFWVFGPANDGRFPRMEEKRRAICRSGLKECGRPAHREGVLWVGVDRWQAGRLPYVEISSQMREGGPLRPVSPDRPQRRPC
jgi:hypothetical protein